MKFKFQTPAPRRSPASGANCTPLGPPSFSSFTDLFRSIISSSPISYADALRSSFKGILGPFPTPFPFSLLPSSRRRGLLNGFNAAAKPRKIINAPRARLFGRVKDVRKCFRCGDRGHFRNQCRNGIKCFNCSGIGHSARLCSKPSASPPSPFAPPSASSFPPGMDRSGEIKRLASVRRLSLPRPSSPSAPVLGRPESVDVFIPVSPSHRSKLSALSSTAIMELFPIARGLPLPSVAQARRILEKNFPPPVWQSIWDPLPFGDGTFLVRFVSRAALLHAFRCGVLWGRKFSCSVRPWSIKEGGSHNPLSSRVHIHLSRIPLLLRDLASVDRLVSGFGILSDPLPNFDFSEDLSALDIAVLVEAIEDVPKEISVVFGDGRYDISLDLRSSDSFSAPSPAFVSLEDGEPDWDGAESDSDRQLDDTSDPIDIDSDHVGDSTGDPEEDPEEYSSQPEDLEQSLEHRPSLFPCFGAYLIRKAVTSSITPSGSISTLIALKHLGRSWLSLSVAEGIPRAISSPLQKVRSFSPQFTIFFANPKISEDLSEAALDPPFLPPPLHPSAEPYAKPRRLKALLGVKLAAAKTVSPKKAADFLPLGAVNADALVTWGRRSGFDIPEESISQVVSGILSLEEAKASLRTTASASR